MSKKTIVLASSFLLLGFFLFATLFKKVNEETITLEAPLLKIEQQLSNVKYIQKWYGSFAATDTNQIKKINDSTISNNELKLSLYKSNDLSHWYALEKDGHQLKVVFSIIMDSLNNNKVILRYENSLWNRLTNNDTLINEAKTSLANLKEYLSDTKKLYGYKIEKSNVTDTTFIFSSATVSLKDKRTGIKNLFESLIQHAKEKNAAYNNTRIFYSTPLGNDSIQLFAGIGINRPEGIAYVGKFTIKRMPYKLNLIQTFYQGEFGKTDLAIQALESYRRDYGFVGMAMPFIKFLTDDIDFPDDKIIQADIFYPVY